MRFFNERKDIDTKLEGEKPKNQILEIPKEDRGSEKLENKKANFFKPEGKEENSKENASKAFKEKYAVKNPENSDNQGKLTAQVKKPEEDTGKGQRERAIYNKEEKQPEKSNIRKLEEPER